MLAEFHYWWSISVKANEPEPPVAKVRKVMLFTGLFFHLFLDFSEVCL